MSLISVRAQLAPSQCPGSSPEEGQELCLHLEAEPVPSRAQESRRVEPMVLPPTYSSLTPQILKELKTKVFPQAVSPFPNSSGIAGSLTALPTSQNLTIIFHR